MSVSSETALVTKIAKAIHVEHPRAWVFKVHGSPWQESGVPDLIVLVDGLFIGMEVKHVKPGESDQHARERATPKQRMQIGKINQAGGMAGVVISVSEALEMIERARLKQQYLNEKTEQGDHHEP